MRFTENDNWLWLGAGLLALTLNFGCLVLALWATLPDVDTISGGAVQRIEIDLPESRDETVETRSDRRDAPETALDKMADLVSPPAKAVAAVPEIREPDTSSDERERLRADGDNATTNDESPGQAVASSAAVSTASKESLPSTRITPGPNTDEEAERIRLTWERRLLVHLSRHKRNPFGASQPRAEVILTFVLRRDGHVLSAKVSKSSGDANIDQAAMAMMRKSDPVPPPPSVVANRGLTFTIPILFLVKARTQ